GNYQGAQEAVSRALAIAQREGDEELEMLTLSNATSVDVFNFNLNEALKKGRRAIELARRIDDPLAEVVAHYFTAWTQLAAGNPGGVRMHLGPLDALADRLRDRSWLSNAPLTISHLSQLEGDWQAARDSSDRGLAVSPMEPRLLAFRGLLEYEVGDFSQGEAYVQRLLEVVRIMPPGATTAHGLTAVVIPLVGHATGAQVPVADAEAVAQTILSSATATPLVATQARSGLALLAISRGVPEQAAEQYDVLQAYSSMLNPGGMVIDRLLGLLAQTLGKPEPAAQHFEDALSFCRKASYRPELAWTCCDYANTLLQRNNPGDRERAMSLLDESLALSTDLGMRPLMERVLSRRDILKA
ncbi:MAG: hypothetical protein ACE5Q6_20630, partial [Dehalococcoidia bacterium]